jgi:hypothetical protein
MDSSNDRRSTRAAWLVIVALLGLKALLDAWILSHGFSHVSDDDYARVVTAQLFAASPKLDPSGTSWLPFPFWLNGVAMIAFGRSLEVARAIAIACGVFSIVPVILAARSRAIHMHWLALFFGALVAIATPWNAWLAVATVPEAMSHAFVAAAVIAMGDTKARRWTAPLLLLAALSRYEAWPACGIATMVNLCDAYRSKNKDRAWAIATAMIAMIGPLLWMAWNAHVHGSAFHFLARVAAYRQSIGAANVPLMTKLTAYPRALWDGAHDVAILFFAGLPALFLRNKNSPSMWRRWRAPLLSALVILVFLIYGDVRDGAPTHHPERALVSIWWVLAIFGADGVRELIARVAHRRTRREAWAVATIAAALVIWSASRASAWNAYPGREPDENREVQIARGAALRHANVAHIDVTPCAYEHFALLASFESPERVTIAPSSHRPVTPSCPNVEQAVK